MDTRFYEDIFKQSGVISSYQPVRKICTNLMFVEPCIIVITEE